MALYPVILCGGGGTRLWPASRPSRPKQFVPMSGNRSLFQDAVLRMAPLAVGGGRVLVIGGVAHRRWILDQLAEVGVEAQVLLEPEARDSAPAMAAAAAWVARADPTGVAAFVASDHHVPDHDAFRAAVAEAGAEAAKGRIVTLGVRPDGPSSAYGYIRPAGSGLSGVAAFVEKPDAATAADYIAAGYLWNSGNFMVSARTLLDELSVFAPGVLAAATSALPAEDAGPVQELGAAFGGAPKISIDYAVMEKTRLADVLAVDFAWSDMGAWDAIAASGEGDVGLHIFEDSDGCLVRAPDGVLVAALGVRNLAIVVEPDAVLVTDLGRSQDVKRVVERVRASSPRHLDFAAAPPEPLGEGARRLADWLRLRALPLWATVGLEDGPGFAEAMGLDGRPLSLPGRSLVQSRQIHTYATAARHGWAGPWRRAVWSGLDALTGRFLRADGTSRALVARDGGILDETARLYDHAFVLLALASARAAGADRPDLEDRAVRLRDRLLEQGLPQGGFLEAGSQPYQANAQMHLLEAAMAWEDPGHSPGDDGWAALSDRIVDLAERRFIDPVTGRLREFYSADWTPASGEDGRLVEPGHQFEWAWLLTRHALKRGRPELIQRARILYSRGREGVSERGGVAQDALNDDGTLRSGRARLWPQTEWLKAALLLAEQSRDGERIALTADAGTALRALWLYLTPDGLWRDKRLPNGGFVDEGAPASSFYHIIGAFDQLAALGGQPGFEDLSGLDLR
ncbi:AGE family epimerase/isomerase [Brevundimonas aurifodinae]|uniref:AGE family epimerase/isomerase n=2 Tax=Brevundimonas TaxID=41275 RepID=A0ABV1NQQ9_9CAUL|nr:MAG: mannose-1-phosphate guanylyltransferase [Brevundimonas subvibrioides]